MAERSIYVEGWTHHGVRGKDGDRDDVNISRLGVLAAQPAQLAPRGVLVARLRAREQARSGRRGGLAQRRLLEQRCGGHARRQTRVAFVVASGQR